MRPRRFSNMPFHQIRKMLMPFLQLGNILKVEGHPNQALEAYQGALAVKPNFTKALQNIGVVLGELGRFDEAIDVYNRAIS